MLSNTNIGNLLLNKQNKQREFGLDVLRTVALLLVIGLHFFLHTDFYNTKLTTLPLLCTDNCFQHVFPYFCCISIIFEYVVVSIICYYVRVYYFKEEILHPLALLFSFGLASYSWYVNMYLGLFLLIPFINILYKSIPKKSYKLILILTLILINSSTGIINCFKHTNITNYWSALYPIMYYLIGCFIFEYKPKINRFALLFVIVLTAMFATSVIYLNNEQQYFDYRLSWYGEIFTVLISISIFLMLYSVKTPNFKPITWFFSMASKASLSAYMLSQLLDIAFYKILNERKPNFISKLPYMPIIVLTTFCMSVLAGYAIFLLYDIPSKIIKYKLQTIKINQNQTTTNETSLD